MADNVKSLRVHEFMEFTFLGTDKRVLIRLSTINSIIEGDYCSIIYCGELGDFKVKNTIDEIKESNQR